MSDTKKIKITGSVAGVFNLAFHVGQEVELPEKQADEIIAAGLAEDPSLKKKKTSNPDAKLQTQLDAANTKATELEAKLAEANTALEQEKTKSAELQTQLDAEKAANEVLGKKLEEALKPATPAKAPDAEKATDKGAANAEKR